MMCVSTGCPFFITKQRSAVWTYHSRVFPHLPVALPPQMHERPGRRDIAAFEHVVILAGM